MSYLLLPVIVTSLLTQAYYHSNIHYQVRIEAEKDLCISQLETYNALCLIKSIDSLITFHNKAYYGNAEVHVFVDEFGNLIKRQCICDTTNVVLKDSTFYVPNFVCNVVAHDIFIKSIGILESNSMNLAPRACELSYKLISFINNHSINNTLTKKRDIIESGWASADIYNEYYKIIDELYQILKLKVENFTIIQ